MTLEKQLIPLPATHQDIDLVRERCRSMVRRRAAIAAGVAAVPIPVLDFVSDLSLFTRLIEEVNQAFGLTQAQIDALQPNRKLVVYKVAMGLGGALIGKLITRGTILRLLRKSGVKMVTKSAARVVPIVGQIASAAIGFALFRKLGYDHVDACARVAGELVISPA